MNAHGWVDELYADFVKTLPAALSETAAALPVVLQLAPSREIPWSEVFSHEVTLGAPRLAAEGMTGLPESAVRDASLAHLLAIIEAFGTDRILDGQVEPSPALEGVLEHARKARDEALARVLALAGDAERDAFARADADTAAAIRTEQAILRSGESVPWARYLAVARGKQRLGLPASLALARAAGWDARRRIALTRTLESVWIGLQLHDDVIDWESDLSRGGAWAASIAAHAPVRVDPRDRKTVPVSTRRLVLESGALTRMLHEAARSFRAARRRAEALGLTALAAWARDREVHLGDLAEREAESPGQTNRAHALSHWAKAVLPQ
ncbi:Hypothetical protein A7982_05041 [Minicystis rosea]|nr:Hypothetical protein A7982_05041 [Minicystis rosea]